MLSRFNRFLGVCLLALPAFGQDIDRAVELYRKNNFPEAESALRRIVEQHGDNARAHRYLALSLLEQHKASEAEPLARKADELESNGESKAVLARLYIEQKDFDKAAEAIKDASGDEARYISGLL